MGRSQDRLRAWLSKAQGQPRQGCGEMGTGPAVVSQGRADAPGADAGSWAMGSVGETLRWLARAVRPVSGLSALAEGIPIVLGCLQYLITVFLHSYSFTKSLNPILS